MKKICALFIIVSLLVVSIVAVVTVYNSPQPEPQTEPFYVGVTYCGNSEQEAMLLVDKVKDYTNLFVLQSGLLQYNLTRMEQICDYAVDSGLNVIAYFGAYDSQVNATTSFIVTAQERWGSKFLGVYYGDESGGKALEGIMRLYDVPSLNGDFHKDQFGFTVVQENASISKRFDSSGSITITQTDVTGYNFTRMFYFTNGTIELTKVETPKDNPVSARVEILTYFLNGTVTLETQESNSTVVTDRGDISQFESYQDVWDSRPFPTYEEIATGYVKCNTPTTGRIHDQSDVNLFTSDYVLYWWDYQIGYDVVLSQLGWNHTLAQDIALVRGAAKAHNKDWGTIITWKYNDPPYLDSGEAIYEQMRMSYECGADYVIVFNYAEGMQGPYGTLQDEHFQALERFWNEVVQSSAVKHGSTEAEAVLVLPQNYGWGMRRPDDTIWGLWNGDENSQQIWQLSRSLLEQYGSSLDIVYEDSAFPVEGIYPKVYYWNQTS
jgi:hypothetical protein